LDPHAGRSGTTSLQARRGHRCARHGGEVDDGFNWVSYGSAAEVARQQAVEEILDKLTERQSDALRNMTHNWVMFLRVCIGRAWALRLTWIESGP
jgi:hypothetical protein